LTSAIAALTASTSLPTLSAMPLPSGATVMVTGVPADGLARLRVTPGSRPVTALPAERTW
jgi:hypothetical protein